MSWSSGLCDVSYECCFACCLPCITIGQNAQKMHELGMKVPIVECCEGYQGISAGFLYSLGFIPVLLSPCVAKVNYIGFLQCGAICFHTMVRKTIRESKEIRTDMCCEDFCCAWCCYSCAMAQEQRELAVSAGMISTNANSMPYFAE